MKAFSCVGSTVFVISLVLNVSQESPAQDSQLGQAQKIITQPEDGHVTSPKEGAISEKEAAEIESSLAKLKPEDRKLAQAQGFCPVMAKNRLGVMGPPVKVMVKEKPVFLCCAGCKRRALANPERTLAIVAKLQSKVAEEVISASLVKLSPDDRRLAKAQGFCPVMVKNRLGVMGTPVKVMVNNEPVFLCCAGCKRRALSNPSHTLEAVENLKAMVAHEAARKSRPASRPTKR
jgi:hypothetical protein